MTQRYYWIILKLNKTLSGRSSFAKQISVLLYIMVLTIPAILAEKSYCMSKDTLKKRTIIYYNNGAELLTSGNVSELCVIIEDSLHEPDDFLELIVTQDLITNIKTDETAIELIYTTETPLVIRTKKVTLKRILIPLSGKYADDGNIVMFCGNKAYSYGPYVKMDGLNKIRKIVDKISWK